MDPLSALSSIMSVAQAIYTQAALAKSNQEQVNRLVERIRLVLSSVSGLSKLPDTRQFMESLQALERCLREIEKFISAFSATKKIWQFFQAGQYKDGFDQYNRQLGELLPQLNVGLTAQELINREQDRLDQRADLAKFESQQAEILRQEELILRAVQGIRLLPAELEAIVRQQLESLSAKMKHDLREAVTAGAHVGATAAGKAVAAAMGAAAGSGGASAGAGAIAAPVVLPSHFKVSFYDLMFGHKIGDSHFGVVYQGMWKEQPVTIKRVEHLPTKADRDAFVHEAQIMTHLHNDYIVPFYGACLESDTLCLLMGVMEMGSLAENLSRLSLTERLQMARDLARGLAYLHGEGIVHGDIRAGTVLINRHTEAKWSDFGLSKTRHTSIATLKTGCSQSAAWQAPESWRRRSELTPASDVYSFGMLLWSLMTVRLPYAGLSNEVIVPRVLAGTRETLGADLLPECKTLIEACWNADPLRRPKAAELVRVLNAVSLPAPSPAPAPRPVSPTGEALYATGVELQKGGRMAEAYPYFDRASSKGYGKAYTTLGMFALKGLGARPLDKALGRHQLEIGATAGHDRAMFNLGLLHEKGDGVAVDLAKALEWYQRALSVSPADRVTQEKVAEVSEALRRAAAGTVAYKLFS